MSYIGRTPVVGNFVKLDAITTSATATYNLLNGGVAYFPQTANNCIVSLNGVIQSPTSAYTISGSTIVFSDALTSSDTIDFILVLGDVLSIGTPSDNTVSLTKLTATGTKDATTFLRGDNTFATVTADGTADWDTSVKTTGFTATANKGYFCNTTSAAFTVTLPATPSAGDEIIILDYAGTFDTNNLTINPNGNKIEGGTGNQQLTGDREGVRLVYIDSTQGWLAYSGIQEGTDGLSPEPTSIEFLVVAGGGAGGASIHGSGGGAGGYRTSTQSVNSGTVITVTVGGGGAGTTSATSTSAQDGSNSSISGSGLTTITSTGGGGGIMSPADATGRSGGSGGGGAHGTSTGGSGNTPSTSPSQGNNGGGGTGHNGPNYGVAGGGGAGATGGNGGNGTTGGAGGTGTASSITGSSVTRAGGGGGSVYNGGTAGSGGTGGGGAGGNASAGTSGTANTGGAGGGAGGAGTYAGGSGGSGVVILKMLTSKYTGTTTGSPTVTTSGSDTILQFNGSGSYTA